MMFKKYCLSELFSKPYAWGSRCHHCRAALSPSPGSFPYTGVQRTGRSEKEKLTLCSLPTLHYFPHFPGFTSTKLPHYFCIFSKMILLMQKRKTGGDHFPLW